MTWPASRPEGPARPAARVLLAGFCLYWFSLTIADPDLWGHVRFGGDILRAGTIPRSDPYSYRTAGQIWINHEWLSEVVFATLEGHAGATGLIALKVALSLTILGLGFRHLTGRGLGPHAAVFLLALVSIPFRLGLGTIRPQIFTYLLFLILLVALDRDARGRGRSRWGLPVLFIIWVNTHGGVLAGVGVLGLWVAGRLVDRWRAGTAIGQGTASDALLFAGCVLALLLNPYGAGLVGFLLREGTVPRPEISEWTPLILTTLPGTITLVLLAVVLAALAFSQRPRRADSVLILAATAVLTLASNRHYPLFVLALIVLAGEHLADVAARVAPFHQQPGRGVAAVSLILGLVLALLSVPRFGCIRIEPSYFAFPTRMVAYLKLSGVRANMAVPFSWGEYVIGLLGPDVKVSIDGRRETVYSDASYRESIDFERGTGVWNALLADGRTDLVLAANGSPTANLMSQAKGWVPLSQDAFCVLFVRQGFPDLDRLLATPMPDLPPDGAGLCYPADHGRQTKFADRPPSGRENGRELLIGGGSGF
jgi:hypothetical protein